MLLDGSIANEGELSEQNYFMNSKLQVKEVQLWVGRVCLSFSPENISYASSGLSIARVPVLVRNVSPNVWSSGLTLLIIIHQSLSFVKQNGFLLKMLFL